MEVEVIGPSGLVARYDFTLNEYGVEASVCILRFGLIHKVEQDYHLDQCLAGSSFGVDHGDRLPALEVAMARSGASRKKGERFEVKPMRM